MGIVYWDRSPFPPCTPARLVSLLFLEQAELVPFPVLCLHSSSLEGLSAVACLPLSILFSTHTGTMSEKPLLVALFEVAAPITQKPAHSTLLGYMVALIKLNLPF